MENLVLVIHLILALCLIAVVLLQRSEGGALGIGGGGGGLVSARGAATALSKVTWLLAIGFICTSILLTVMAGGRQDSVIIGPGTSDTDSLLIPAPSTSGGAQDDDVPLPPSSN
ncbi:MAG: preprotein translocase subunit SecG [Pseudomonadota bacterium]